MSAPPTMPPPPPCKGAFTMTVSYSEDKKMANGSYIQSTPIDVGGHSWCIIFYPNGRLAGSAGFMSLFLLLDDAAAEDDKDVHVKLRFMMHEIGSGTMTFTSGELAAAVLNKRRHDRAGFMPFVSHEEFEKSALFKNDHFEIRCELTVFPAGSQTAAEASISESDQPSVVKAPPPVAAPPKPSAVRAAPPSSPTTPCAASPSSQAPSAPPSSPMTPPPAPSVERATPPPPPPSGLHADLGRLLSTKEGADVEIEVCGKVFAAHKSVLAARSSVFMAAFFGPTKEEDTSYVSIGSDDDDDMRPEAFEALLHYMYTDSLPEMMTMDSPEQAAAAVLAAEDLLVAADRYNLKDLKSLTENKLCGHVGVGTVLLLLGLAERCQCCVLKKMCLGFIGSSSMEDTREIVAGDNVEKLARSSPSVVKDVITEILDERRRRLKLLCICVLCFFMPFVVFSFLHVTFL